jgi:hypothetical protein
VVVHTLLNSAPAQDLLGSLLFTDAKRPITKRLLMRIDVGAVLATIADEDIVASTAESSSMTTVELRHALSRLCAQWAKPACRR